MTASVMHRTGGSDTATPHDASQAHSGTNGVSSLNVSANATTTPFVAPTGPSFPGTISSGAGTTIEDDGGVTQPPGTVAGTETVSASGLLTLSASFTPPTFGLFAIPVVNLRSAPTPAGVPGLITYAIGQTTSVSPTTPVHVNVHFDYSYIAPQGNIIALPANNMTFDAFLGATHLLAVRTSGSGDVTFATTSNTGVGTTPIVTNLPEGNINNATGTPSAGTVNFSFTTTAAAAAAAGLSYSFNTTLSDTVRDNQGSDSTQLRYLFSAGLS